MATSTNTPKATSIKSRVMKAAKYFFKQLGNRSEALRAAWSFVKNASNRVKSDSRGIITLGAMHPKHLINKVAKISKGGATFAAITLFMSISY